MAKKEKTTKKPLHQQAEEVLEEIINAEEYQNGKLLPNEVELASQLNMSRNTLRQAINKLVIEGKLERKKGVGTWVTKRSAACATQKWLSFSQEMEQIGVNVKNYEIHVSEELPPKEVKKFFNLNEGENIYCLKLIRIRGDENYPFVLFISYFNPNLKISVDEDFKKPLYELLEQKYGIIVETCIEEISAKSAGREIASWLKISENSPILVRRRNIYDVKNQPIEYNIGYYRADRFSYTIKSKR